jgi:hypothetical protein
MGGQQGAGPKTVTANPDPTYNVTQLNEASVKRLDDIAALRAAYDDKLRLSDEKLRNSELKRIDDVSKLRSENTANLAQAEKSRIDAVRVIDVSAVATASEKTAQQANVLASQMAASFETLRSLISTATGTLATQLGASMSSMDKRIAELEKTTYVGTGRQALSEPMLSELATEIKSLRESRDVGSGTSKGSSTMWAYVIAGVMAFLGMGSLLFTVMHLVTSK